MLAFITSLRHPDNASDYAQVERLLAGTLYSVAGQDSHEFVVIVVGNRAPSFALPARTHFVPVEFAPPVPPGRKSGWEDVIRDKGGKLGIGLIAARAYDPDYVMIFDADDLVSRRVAAFVEANGPGRPGWVVRNGYVYSSNRSLYKQAGDFNHKCGTCIIAPYAAYAPSQLELDATQEEVVDAFGERLRMIIGAHYNAADWLTSRGYALEPLPFRGVAYHLETGENHSGKGLKGLSWPVDAAFATEFNVPFKKPELRSWWDALGPKASLESLRNLLAPTKSRMLRLLR